MNAIVKTGHTSAAIAAAMSANTDFKAAVAAAVKDAVTVEIGAAVKQIEKDPAHSAFAALAAPNISRGAEPDKRTGVQRCAAMIRYMAAGQGDPERAAKLAKEVYGDEMVSKSLTTAEFTGGGALVPQDMVPDIFEALRANSVVRSLNPTIYPMNEGSLTLPGITGGANAAYKGESVEANATQQTTGDVRLVERELICIVPVSTSLLRVNSGRAETAISNDMMRAMGQAEDTNFLNGDGTEGKPLGILQQMLPANSSASAGTSLANVDTDLAALKKVVRAANVNVNDAAFIMDTDIEEDLLKFRTPSGDNKAFAEMENDRLVKTRYGSSNNMTSGVLAYGSMADVIIGESENIEVMVSDSAAYRDSSGNLRASFSANEVVIRMVMKHDIALRYQEAWAQKTGVAYTG